MKDTIGAIRVQLEHDSVVADASELGGAVDVPRAVSEKVARRINAVVIDATEAVERGFLAIGRQPENCSVAKTSAGNGSAVEVARRVPNQAAPRVLPVWHFREGVKHLKDLCQR